MKTTKHLRSNLLKKTKTAALLGWLLLSTFPFSCSAESVIEDATSTFSSVPQWTVAGCVSAISGQYFIAENDLVIRGAQPLSIPRNYLSLNEYGKGGWSSLNHLFLEVKKVGNDHFYFSTHDTSGIPLIFGRENGTERKKEKYPLNTESYGGTLLNTSGGEISGRTNLKNAYALFAKSACRVYLPNGTVRIYGKKIDKRDANIEIEERSRTLRSYRYLLTQERLPNGNKIFYEWDFELNRHRVKTIFTTGPLPSSVYAVANYDKNKILSSDGREISYSFSPKKRHLLGLSIIGLPDEILEYEGARLKSRKFEDASCLNISYCSTTLIPYKNEYIKNGKIIGKEQGHRIVWPTNAVEYIAKGEEEYFFSYTSNPYPRIARETEVIDSDGGKTLYRTSNNAPRKIVYFDNEEQPIRSIEYHWDQGNLSCLTYKNQSGTPYKTVQYEYDTCHNIRREILSGDGIEAITEYRYNSCNLPIWKKEPSGKITTTSYLSNTDLPTTILVGDDDKIFQRQFFAYNRDNILIESIQDDGSSQKPDSLHNVTYRKIKRIKPHRAGESSTEQHFIPALNLPGEISEYYYENSKEHLLTKTRYSYDDRARITEKEIIDADNTSQYTLTYEYDDEGRLITSTDPLGQTTIYTYDNQNNCLSEEHPYKKLEIHRTYDNRNCLISESYLDLATGSQETTRYSYDRKKRKTSETDSRGNTTSYRYNSNDLITEKELPDGTLLTYAYDAAGNCIEEKDGRDFITKTSYNARDQKTHTLYPDQTEEHFFYNPDGTLASHTDQIDRITRYTYDILGCKTEITLTVDGQVISTETYRYKGPNLIYKELPGKQITTYSYDGAGRLIHEQTGEKELSYEYDRLGRLHKTIEGERIQIREYDNLSRSIQEEYRDTSDTLYSTTTHTYDGHNNKKTTTNWIDNNSSTTIYIYNGLNQLIEKTDPLERKTKISYQNSNHNLIKKIIQPDQTYRIETYDANLRLLQKEWYNKEGKYLRSETHAYDENDNLIQTTLKPKNQTINYEYDACNRKVSQLESNTKKTSYSYTPDGLQNLIIKPDGTEIHKTYTPQGQLKTLISSDNTINYQYEYDNRNRLTKVYDHNNPCLKRSYDNQNRLIKEKFLDHYSIIKTYDIYNRPLTLTYPDKQTATYSYDPYHLKTVEYDNYTHTYESYNTSGQPLLETLPAGLGEQTHTYDLLKRETNRTNPHQTESRSYNLSGNLESRTLNDQTERYTYDDLNQLISENSRTYSYDTNYNRQSKNDQTYHLNNLNQVEQTAHIIYTYDSNGNPITKQTPTGTTHYTYDALNRLIAIQTPTQSHHYSYGPFNRRLTANGDYFIYDNRKEIGKISSNTITERRILGNTPANEIGATILYEQSSHLKIPLHSIDGNIITLLNPDGTPTHNLAYSAFGETTSTNLPWTYQSKRQDPTGLIYFGSRYYDPGLARFLTPDPVGFTDSYNLYSYLLNRPFVAFDPNGEFIITVPLFVSGTTIMKSILAGVAIAGVAWAANETSTYVNQKLDVSRFFVLHQPQLFDEEGRYIQNEDFSCLTQEEKLKKSQEHYKKARKSLVHGVGHSIASGLNIKFFPIVVFEAYQAKESFLEAAKEYNRGFDIKHSEGKK